jgi:GAF domain-containing protein
MPYGLILPKIPTFSDRLALLYDLTQTFTSTLDLDEVLNRVMDRVIQNIRAERGFVLVVDDNEQFKIPGSARWIKAPTNPEYLVSKSITESRSPVRRPTRSMHKKIPFHDEGKRPGFRLAFDLCVPVVFKATIWASFTLTTT